MPELSKIFFPGLGWGDLSIDAAGDIFGTTYGGGTNCNSGGYCGGTAFELTPNSEYSVLYNFPITTGSASNPDGVIPDNSGNLYGTTGGGQYACGTVVELSLSGAIWNSSTLYQFTGGTDGCGPAGVILDASHNLYGVTYSAGSASADYFRDVRMRHAAGKLRMFGCDYFSQ